MFRSDMVVPDIVSCDVFDTLLHRDGRSEASRQRAVARLAVRRLAAERGVVVPAETVRRARAEAQRYAYRALDMLHPSGEVRFADLIAATAERLALGPVEATILAESEIAVERAQLAPNRPLLAWLAAQARDGRRIVAVSDTWHDAATIRALLDALAPGHPIARVYTSADHDATKRSAALFAHVLQAEGARPDRILHIGDDAVADLAMARVAGLRCAPVQRPRTLRIRRKLDAVLARLRPAAPSVRELAGDAA